MSSSIAEALEKAANKSDTAKTQLIKVKKYLDRKSMREIKYKKRLIPLMDLSHQMFVEIDDDKPFFEMAKPYIRRVCKYGTNKQYSDTTRAISLVFVTSQLCTQRQSWQVVYNSLGITV